MKHLLAATAAIALAVGFTPPAQAVLMLSANINGTIVTCADQQASCDTNPAVGQLALADQTVAGVQFLGSSQTQVIGPTNSLNTASFQFINNNAGSVNLQLAVSGTDFQGPVATFSASGGGTFQSAIGSNFDLTFFGDTANSQGADFPTDLPGTQLATSGVVPVTLATQSIAFNSTGSFVDPNVYSQSLGTTILLTSAGSVVGRTQTIVTSQTTVSEPGTLGILGGSLVAGGLVLRRRRKRTAPDGFAAA
jgi:hypothetical protein